MKRIKIVSFFLAFMSGLCLGLTAPQSVSADTFLSADFETNPTLSGWTTTANGADWTTANAHSGTHSLYAQTSNWYSPGIATVPLQWYQLTFWSKAPGTVNNAGSIGYGYYAVEYYDQNGALWQSDQYESIYQSNGWVRNDMRIRAKAAPGPNGTLLPLTVKVSFHPIGNQPLYIDDVTLQSTAPADVAHWADSLYAGEPKLTYVPKGDRWAHIPLTMQKLRGAQKVRIVMLGDSVQCDSANSPIDVFLAREYPGSAVELIVSTGHGTGVNFFTDKVAAYVTDYVPDLLIIGGISNPDPSTSAAWQSIIDQVHAYDTANGHKTEIMVVTRNWSPNNINGGGYWLADGMNELDQYLTLNASIPDNYQGHLLNFAAAHGLEFFDMTGVDSQFIYGPANAAGLGPPDENGNPYSYWMRDYIHSNTHAKQIAGRIFEKFFEPVTIPTAPTLFKPVLRTRQVTLSWTASAGASSYSVKRGTASGGPYTNISPAGGVTGTTFTDTNGAVGACYYVVSAQNANGGSANSNQVSATIAVSIATPQSIAVSSASVYGGAPVTVSVTLTKFAPAGGLKVLLGSSYGNMIPAGTSITVPAGSARASLVAHTLPSAATIPVKLTASAAGVVVTTILTIKSPDLTGLALSPLTVSSGQSVTVKVTLGSVAPPAGISVPFTSNSPALKGASVLVPGGKSAGALIVKTTAVSEKTAITLTATRNGLSKSATLIEMPPALTSFTVSASSISGGAPIEGNITLSGPAGPSGLVIALTGSNSSVTVPAQVVVKAWATSVTFSIATHTVSARTTAKISAVLGSVTKVVDVLVLPHASAAINTGVICGRGMRVIEAGSCLAHGKILASDNS